MKGNKMMNISCVLFVLVLLTTCGLSKTYAKYTTQASGGDQARVAKWGVNVAVEGDGTFSNAYDKGGNSILTSDYLDVNQLLKDAKTLSFNYKAETNTKVIAPGTSGTLCNLKISGTPEVAVNITATGTLITNKGTNDTTDGWIAAKFEYFPIIFTIDDKDYGIGKDGIGNIDELSNALSSAVSKLNRSYAPNTDLENEMVDGDKVNDLVITWRWPFRPDEKFKDPVNSGLLYHANVKDTALTDSSIISTISFDLEVEVVQID